MAPRILILRPDNIGDCIIFSGALRSFRQHWPDARIDMAVQPRIKELFRFCPHIDRVLSTGRLAPWERLRNYCPRGTWRLESLLLSDLIRKFWYPRYDIVVYPVSAPVENWLAAVRLMDASEKWGYGGEQLRLVDLGDDRNTPERVFTHCFANTAENRWLHESERTLLFLQEMGIDARDLAPELWLTDDDRDFAQTAIPDGTLGLFVGAGSHWRQWPAEKWKALAGEQDAYRSIAVMGASSDGNFTQAVRRATDASAIEVIDLAGKTTLRQLAACIAGCEAVVSNDSAGLHFAVAADVPAVGIMGGYHFGRFYPWGRERIHRTANVKMDCYYCNDDCIYNDWRCVRDIGVETVLSELKIAAGASQA